MAKKTKKKVVRKKQDVSNFNAAHKARDKQLKDKRPHFIVDTKSCFVLIKKGKGEYEWSRKSLGALKLAGEFRAKLTLGQLRAKKNVKLPQTVEIMTYPRMLKTIKSKPVAAAPKVNGKSKTAAAGLRSMSRTLGELVVLSDRRNKVQAELDQVDTQIKQLAQSIAS